MDPKPPSAGNGVVIRVLATIGGISTGLAVLAGLAVLFAIAQNDRPITYRFPSPGGEMEAVAVVQSGGGAISYCATSVFVTRLGAKPEMKDKVFAGDCHAIGDGPYFKMAWASDKILIIRPVVGESAITVQTQVRGADVKVQFIF